MTGSYDIKIKNEYMYFELKIERQVTIIKGLSGSGKTKFLSILRDFKRAPELFTVDDMDWLSSVSIRIITDNDIIQIDDTTYSIDKYIENCIYFIDDDVDIFNKSNVVESIVSGSNSYFVILVRDGSNNKTLNYAQSNVLRVYSSVEDNFINNIIKPFYKPIGYDIKPDVVITEDKGIGFELAKIVFDCDVLSGGGFGSIYRKIRGINSKYKNITIIADNSNFKDTITSIIGAMKITDIRLSFVLPESLEYILLHEYVTSIQDELLNPSDYSDTRIYKTWERYFTSRYKKLCEKRDIIYSKANSDLITEHMKSLYERALNYTDSLCIPPYRVLVDLDFSITNDMCISDSYVELLDIDINGNDEISDFDKFKMNMII